ncbi:hypothetical protein LTR78_010986 [Recurvomyces mirabilis]|uniref:Uncharacterized protein n=1 Tax=Recurvomyces mirabilis TaxID=574656 RepID=A0AAE0TR39_9PEZI|nr:hypothetical protein LTR78_010986 [Recurvomyces mirabilis]KAK5149418.1 hypothetical protein LTS14_010960 [Recurvomyces mirabilis]
MQTEAQSSRNEMSEFYYPTALQAERARIAAENNLRRETRRGNASLRRLVGHIAVLEGLDHTQSEQSSDPPPPSYSESVTKPRSTSRPDICLDSASALPNSDDTPGLEADEQIEDDSNDDKWWNDGDVMIDNESDADLALVRVYSHPPTYIQETHYGKRACNQSKTFDLFETAGALCEMMGKVRNSASFPRVGKQHRKLLIEEIIFTEETGAIPEGLLDSSNTKPGKVKHK